MKIALDYDETYTEDKSLWNLFVLQAKNNGHEVKFVTYRFPSCYEPYSRPQDNIDIEADAKSIDIDIIYTCSEQKSDYYDADIWIDDSPITIPDAKTIKNFKTT